MALLSRLFMLVAVALLPAIAIQSYNEFELRHSRQMEVQEQALGLAKLAAAQQQQIVGGIRQVLIALSELPAIKARAAEACSAYLSTIKRRYPAFLTFAAVDMNGQSFCTTNGKTANVADRSYFAAKLIFEIREQKGKSEAEAALNRFASLPEVTRGGGQ